MYLQVIVILLILFLGILFVQSNADNPWILLVKQSRPEMALRWNRFFQFSKWNFDICIVVWIHVLNDNDKDWIFML